MPPATGLSGSNPRETLKSCLTPSYDPQKIPVPTVSRTSPISLECYGGRNKSIGHLLACRWIPEYNPRIPTLRYKSKPALSVPRSLYRFPNASSKDDTEFFRFSIPDICLPTFNSSNGPVTHLKVSDNSLGSAKFDQPGVEAGAGKTGED
jgi:hypothetical protein